MMLSKLLGIAKQDRGVFGQKVYVAATWRDVYRKLAELIEPQERTCRNKQIGINKSATLEFRNDNFICSACHETFFADNEYINHPIDWAYCPNCGARIAH